MSERLEQMRPGRPETVGTSAAVDMPAGRAAAHPTDHPIPVWPEGVLALVAGATLVLIGLRHRVWLQRKVGEAQRAVEEFQKQGGVDDLTQVVRHAAEFLRAGGR